MSKAPLGAALAAATFALCLLIALAFSAPASALSLKPIGSFDEPVFLTSDPADPERLFVVEKQGTVTLLDHGVRRPFLDLSGEIAGEGEQGLLSIAFDPDYTSNRRFYAFYVVKGSGALRIAEFTADAAGNQAPSSSRRVLLTIDHSYAPNHNGGQLQIGPDGYLYIGTGDGGGGGDPQGNGQNRNSLLGKLLRIDPDPGPGGAPYTIPADNPFAGATPGADEIWSYGLRNPYRFSFDRLTGALTIGDVGQGEWEEVNYAPQAPAGNGGRGVNYGWNCREGAHDYKGGCSGFTDPVFEYSHAGGACSITGGYVDRDPGTPAYAGRYLYADFCQGQIRSLLPGDGSPGGASGDRSEGMSVAGPSSFGEDSCGRLYVASLREGTVFRIEGATPTRCDGVQPPPPPPPDPVDRGPCKPSTQLGDASANRLLGTPSADRLSGLGGADTLVGRGGADCLAGGAGADALRGGKGPDKLYGGNGRDRINGGKGKDKLYGGAGRDRIRGGPGADRILARDGTRDVIDCGKGRDTVIADRIDKVAGNCERVKRRGSF